MIKETANALQATGLADLGYKYVNLDDCWQNEKRNKDGSISPNPERFPSGLAALGDYLHSKDFLFGIYSSAGFKTCQGFPSSLGIEEIDVASYVDWGVDYLKYDNCYQDHGSPHSRYGVMGSTLKQSNREIFYSLCEWGRENPAVWGREALASSWRISGDIYDGWSSIVSRAAIGASLWRYAGPGGWNDPDMLEVGNGQCTDEEYKSHFSLWAMLKAPLIIGNDVRDLQDDSDQSKTILSILGNKEVIAINQDPLGRQGRIVWSDTTEKLAEKGFGDKLIATKCATGDESNIIFEDSPNDQQWELLETGKIRSKTTGLCLLELDSDSDFYTVDKDKVEFHDFTLFTNGVTTAPCRDATSWKFGQFVGGSIVSEKTGNCLEVSKFEFLPLVQGKRIQTAKCKDEVDGKIFDVREHQSWTTPHGVLRNLYQRQCLTIDRDAFSGIQQEIWATPLSNGYAVLLFNKGNKEIMMSFSREMIGIPASDTTTYRIRDLWRHADLLEPLSVQHDTLKFPVRSHGVVMLKLSR